MSAPLLTKPSDLSDLCWEICKLRAEGIPQEDIADMVGRDQSRVSRHLSFAVSAYPVWRTILMNRRGRPRKAS